MWRNRATPGVEDETAPDLEAEAAAIGRLRRVVGRADGRDVPDAAPAAAAPDCFAGSGLTGNAFAVLGVGLDASAQAISDAVDDLSFEPGHDPDALNAARASLMSARDRLGEELGWLPEMSPELLAQVRAGLKAGDVAAVTAARDATIGLARLNLGLALAVAVPGEVERAVRVISDGQAWDSNATLGLLGEARARAGFRPIDDDLYDGAVRERAVTVAQALAPLFAATTSARAALTKAMQGAAAAATAGGGGGFGAMFLDEVMRCYAAGIDPALEAAAAKIAAATAALKERPGDQGQAIALTAGLEIWSSLRRPVQVHEAARGLDDPASAAIFDSVRSLTVTLSNDHDEYDIALRLARALIASFALVPFHRAALEQQMPVLIGNVLVKRLRQACARGLVEHASFAREVLGGGLERAGGLAGAVAASFAEAVDGRDEGDRASAFIIVRGLAIDLANEHRERRTALAIMQWLLLLDPPVEVRAKLTADVQQLGGEAPVPAYSRPSPRQPSGDGGQSDSSPAPGSFGRANRGGAPAAPQGQRSSAAWVPPPPEMPPAWTPTPGRQRPRGRVPIGVVLMLCAMVSFCSRIGGRHRASEASLPVAGSSSDGGSGDTARYGSASGTFSSSRAAAIEARIRDYNARLENEGNATPNRIVPGRPMSDARPMDPTPAVDRPGYSGDEQ